jgi:LysR family hydrogen peroxide-inducible transcriptional activator
VTLQQLQYTIALDEHRHFGNAAKACFVTQPTLTMQVRRLEAELDVILFDRRAHPIRPTEVGSRIVAHARTLLLEAERIKSLVKEMHLGLAGHFNVGVIPTLAPYLLPLFLTRFAEASRILKGLRRGDLDVGLLVTPVDNAEFEEIPLFREPFLAYLPKGHRLWHKRTLERSDLRDGSMWVLGEGHCFRDQTLSLCDRPSAAHHQNLLYESGSIETLKRLVRNGSGMTLVPELSVATDDPHVRRFGTPEPVRQVSLVVRRPFARRKFIEALSQHIAQALPPERQSVEVIPMEH